MKVSLTIAFAFITSLLLLSGLEQCQLKIPENEVTLLHGGLAP